MSRKRMAPVGFLSNGIPPPNIQACQYEYYRPGCYLIPQLVTEVTPYTHTYMDHWQPYCNTATYVVDRFGNVNYPSDFEYQLHVPTAASSLPRDVLYRYYEPGETGISLLPQIEDDDFCEEQEVIVRKRKRLSDRHRLCGERRSKNSLRAEDSSKNVYRSNEGYLVEEPSDNAPESV